MGKLNKQLLVSFVILPTMVVASGAVWFVLSQRPLLANQEKTAAADERTVYTKTYEGFTQIVVKTKQGETFLTDDRFNNRQPYIKGSFVIWIREFTEEEQVVLYNLDERTAQTIASGQQFSSPKVATNGQAVWQRWKGDNWHITYFDGKAVQELPFVGLYPDITENTILFARKTVENDWELVQYNPSTQSETVLAVDPSVKQAWIDGTTIRFPNGELPLYPSPTPSAPQSITPPVIMDPETTPNEPDMVEGMPSRVPPGDERLFYGDNSETPTQEPD